MADLINDGRPFRSTMGRRQGLSRQELQGLIDTGVVRRVIRGVLVDASIDESRDVRCAALSLVVPAHVIICRSTAAWLWGVEAYEPETRGSLAPECVVPHHLSRQRRAGVRTYEARIDAGDIADVSGIRVTTPERTAVDLLRWLRRPFALSAVDALAHAGLVDSRIVRRRVARLAGYPGVRQARELAPIVDGRVESPGESWSRLRLVDAELPCPAPQIEVLDRHGHVVFRLDNGYRRSRIGIEYDGLQFHSGDDAIRDEHRRERLRREFGWHVITCDRAAVLGPDPWLEERVGELLGLTPRLDRRW